MGVFFSLQIFYIYKQFKEQLSFIRNDPILKPKQMIWIMIFLSKR